MKSILHVNSINELHKLMHYGKPKHPLISLMDLAKTQIDASENDTKIITNFYSITFKKIPNGTFLYGRKNCDYDEASLLCISPGQTITIKGIDKNWHMDGWGLFFHQDLIRNTFLMNKIEEYSFLGYNENESLHLSEHESDLLQKIINVIETEYQLNLDVYSRDIIVSNIEVLLNYCRRFYGRQFITRTSSNYETVGKFENYLKQYFTLDITKADGLPTVSYFADKLSLSASYLSDLLKQETGKSAKEHIHFKLIEVAKNRLLASNEPVSHIAYDLGFEQSQNFSRLFKQKTGYTPKEFRNTSE
ncbi:helix-turn-helix domain-containing protein [Aureibacter tunicatorum]|uniref:AraC-like DNA-binding protein n=1 Tax=Aureibacter tunicatorum TaxID=866807 RepID=A0AAE4BSD7_9BACT|nr:helix-turn-helix transcriptional regulator [Aureibacter tunicatorum]MDR6239651.1 AraC-like DNA-binding protein [Aureibacter tunicatorum]BDD04127.1 hypothetical protein AUTU_16100 [Aureibacter tunicatorum]